MLIRSYSQLANRYLIKAISYCASITWLRCATTKMGAFECCRSPGVWRMHHGNCSCWLAAYGVVFVCAASRCPSLAWEFLRRSPEYRHHWQSCEVSSSVWWCLQQPLSPISLPCSGQLIPDTVLSFSSATASASPSLS